MLYLESFIHRVRFAEIVSRWMVNQPRPDDVRQLKAIVNFNSYITRIWVDSLAKRLLYNLYAKEPFCFPARTKGRLKDFVVKHPLYTNRRIEEMLRRYRRFPEDFFRETPFDGMVYYTREAGQPLFMGTTRIKRFRRIAEKGSRRIVDFMFERIRGHADDLAAERAKRLGITKDQLITAPEEMVDEFRHAERRLIKSIKRGTIQSELPILSIPDVVGIKLIVEADQYPRLLDVLTSNQACTLLEQERHSGNYNATNLRVAYTLPKEMLLKNPPSGHSLNVLAHRGFDPSEVAAQFAEFLDTSEDHVLLEIIVVNFHDFLESEIGRSMHEERVLEQRSNQTYRSPLATSIRYLMDYMLTLCLSPGDLETVDVPIKLWVKYMPDTIDRLIRDIYNVPSDSSFDFVAGRSLLPAAAETAPSESPKEPAPATVADSL
jgi:hypothetical protein